MNFFEHQDQARRSSSRLILLFILTVVALILGLYLVLVFMTRSGEFVQGSLWRPELFFTVAAGTCAVVGLGTGYKLSMLSSGGGAAVAESLGGRPVSPATMDPNERKLLNVVEEMAIASGVPTPTVYLLEEQGINAFAAGFSPQTAVVGITRGCMERLTRDQLQGVVAHEFSHILNGDMRLNLRLIGVLHGILLLSYIGQGLLRSMMYSSALGGRRRSRRDSGGIGVIGLALALMVLGWIGVFFGSLIKAAVSRQREFLADASAVQFTRNPDGIAGALKAIGAHASGSKVEAPNTAEASHLFFGQALTSMLGSPFATHPPLDERIRRIDPQWSGDFGPPPSMHYGTDEPTISQFSVGSAAEQLRHMDRQIGRPGTQQLAAAAALLRSIPDPIRQGLHEAHTARGVIYGLLISDNDAVRKQQEQYLDQYAEADAVAETRRLLPELNTIQLHQRLPLIDLAVPVLKTLSHRQYAKFKNAVVGLVAADQKITLFEWVLMELVRHHLAPTFEGRITRSSFGSKSLANLATETSLLLSAMVHFGVRNEYQEQAAALVKKRCGQTPNKWTNDWDALDQAMEELQTLSPDAKLELLQLCADTILVDDEVPIEAAELLRAVSDLLDCPMPPLGIWKKQS